METILIGALLLLAVLLIVFWFLVLPVSFFFLIKSYKYSDIASIFFAILLMVVLTIMTIPIFMLGLIVLELVVLLLFVYWVYRRNKQMNEPKRPAVIPAEYQRLIDMKNKRDRQIARDKINTIRRMNKLKPLPDVDEDHPEYLPFDKIDGEDEDVHIILQNRPSPKMTELGGCLMTGFILYIAYLILAVLANHLR